jgi:fucose permease
MHTIDFVRRRKQRWILIAFFFLSGMITASWSSRIPDIQHKLALDNRSLGNVLFAVPAGLVLGLLLASRLVARYGTKRIMRTGCVILALALLLTAFTSGSLQLMMALFLLGMSRTIFNLSINTTAVDLQKQYDEPIMSRFHGIWSAACLAAAGIGTFMIIQGVKPFVHFAGIAIVAVVLSLLLISRQGKQAPPEVKVPLVIKPDRYLFLLGLIALCAMLCESAMFDWSVNYFDKVVKADKAFITVGYTCFIAAMTLGRLFGDRLIAAFGIYRMLTVNAISMAAGLLLAALLPQLLPASIGFMLIGFGDSMLVPMIYLLASQSKKMTSNYALQAVTLVGYGGFLIGPLFVGNVSQLWGMNYAFLLLSGVSLFILVLTGSVKRLAVTA